MYKLFLLVIIFKCVSSLGQYEYTPYDNAYGRLDEKRDFYAHPSYSYEYNVHDPHTGDVKRQAEQRDGDVVQGYYTFNEADGTIRQVHYSADKHSGFRAQVKRIGKAYHPKVYKTENNIYRE